MQICNGEASMCPQQSSSRGTEINLDLLCIPAIILRFDMKVGLFSSLIC